jgi:hypothetical protein
MTAGLALLRGLDMSARDYSRRISGRSVTYLLIHLHTGFPSKMTREVTEALPSNSEEKQSRNGRVYFCNHMTKATTWIDPKTDFDDATAATCPASAATDLPDGWEQKIGAEGRVYFADLHTKTTTWSDLR